VCSERHRRWDAAQAKGLAKAVKARKEKYSVEAVKNMLTAADKIERHTNNQWSRKTTRT